MDFMLYRMIHSADMHTTGSKINMMSTVVEIFIMLYQALPDLVALT